MLTEWLPDTDLVIRYRRFMYEFADQQNVQNGLRLFMAGIGLATVALVLFLWAYATDSYYAWVEPAYATGLLALPLVVLSIVVLLKPSQQMRRVGIAGIAITAIATVGFVLAYPRDWNGYGADYTPYVVSVYAIGMASLTAAMGTALKAHAPQLIRTITEIGTPEAVEPAASNARPDGPSIVTLIVNGERYSFRDGETFGRREELWLADLVKASGGHHDVSYISGEHLEFTEKDDGVYVTDLSQNGTALNGRDLDGGEAKLSDGDTLVLAGDVEIGVEL